MAAIDKEDFLEFLAECLMYDEEPLSFDNAMPEQVFDSVGKLMTSAALKKKYGVRVSLDKLAVCVTPGDIYALL